MRILITGASGNIGTALLRRLDATEHTVVGVARRPPARGHIYDVAEWHAIDVTAPAAVERLTAAMAGVDVVVHLIWGFQPSHDAAYLRRLDVGGTESVLAAAVAAGVPHLVHLSSSGAYSRRRDDDPVDESWPTDGIGSLPYSRHKAAVERLLDDEEARRPPRLTVTRVRPALVGNELAGGELLRNTYPAWAPTAVLRHLPVLPLDRGFRAQFVHGDDLAEAVVRIIDRRAGGAFNITAEDLVRREDLARLLGAKPVHLPWRWLRTLAAWTWRARLQPVDPGWLDLATTVPILSAERARRELGWEPTQSAVTAVSDALDGMRRGSGTPSPALRRRQLHRDLLDVVRRGLPSQRHLP